MKGRFEGSCRAPLSVGCGTARVTISVSGIQGVDAVPLVFDASVQEAKPSSVLIWCGKWALGIVAALLVLSALIWIVRRAKRRPLAVPDNDDDDDDANNGANNDDRTTADGADDDHDGTTAE